MFQWRIDAGNDLWLTSRDLVMLRGEEMLSLLVRLLMREKDPSAGTGGGGAARAELHVHSRAVI